MVLFVNVLGWSLPSKNPRQFDDQEYEGNIDQVNNIVCSPGATCHFGQLSTKQYTCSEPESDGSTTKTTFNFKRNQGNQCKVEERIKKPNQQEFAKLSVSDCSWVPKCYSAGPSSSTKKYTCFKGKSDGSTTKTTFNFKRKQGNQCEVEERIKNPNQQEFAKLSINDCSWIPKCYSARPSTNANCRTQDESTTIQSGKTDNDNPHPDQPCVFPFIWAGVKHNSCVNDDDAGGSWCSTKVDRYGKYIDRKWGICSPTCPVSDRYGSTCEPNGNSFKCQINQWRIKG